MLTGKPKGKRPLRIKRRKSVDNIKIDLGEIEWDVVDWMCVAQDRNKG